MEIAIQWNAKGMWYAFNLEEIAHMSRNHAIALFSNPPSVRAKQGNMRITNRESIRDQYLSKNQPCKLFSELAPDDRPLQVCGFI